MGLRMYINEHTRLGKCYGYAFKETPLYSLDYLCFINAFDEWMVKEYIDTDLWNVQDSGDMREYFNCSQCTNDIYLTPVQFTRFIYLYISDGLAVWGPERWNVEGCVDTLRQVMNDVEREPDKKICIHWG